MNPSFIAFLAGLFGVPIALLALGHRLRRRSPRARATFRGAVIGHCVAGILAVVWGMIPPEAWEPTETARGFAGLWTLLLFPLAGALVGALRVRRRAAIAPMFIMGLLFDPGVAVSQEGGPSLVGVIGHWTHLDDGGPAVRVDGARWSGKTATAELRSAARPLFGTVSEQFIANGTAVSAFPLAVWSGVASFSSGTIKVDFKLAGGASDQNAGVVIGLQPSGEYLFVRYNTKDGNIAVWRYADSTRTVLTHGHEHAQLPLGKWHELTVTVAGSLVTAAVTGTPLRVEHELDKPLAGRVGLWTKRDAITVFRNYRVTP